MATSLALIMVCDSFWLDASIYVMVDVGKRTTEAPSHGLPILRDLSVYIHALGLCRGCHSIVCGREESGLRVWFCTCRIIGRSFTLSGCGVCDALVFELSSLALCVACLVSQESMLKSVV